MPNWPGFLGPSNPSQSALANCSRLVNWYMEPVDAMTGRPALYPTPGQQSFVTVGDTNTRALASMNGRTFGIVGSSFGELFSGGTFTKYATVALDAFLGGVTLNGAAGNQALVASGSNAYSFDLATNVLSAAVLTGEATQIGMLDGYGVAFNKHAGKFRLSDLNDFSTWDPTQFAIRTAAPDNWQAMLVNAPDIWLIGEQSGDVWYDAGTSPFPFAPRPGATFKYGIAATFSIAAAGDSVFWLSRNAEGAGIVVRARGYVPIPISTYAVETSISTAARTSTISDAEALTFQVAGHTLYVLRFPTANLTWAYDLKTNLWFELGTWNSAANRYDVWHPRATTYAFGKHLVGDATTGQISVLDETYGLEADGSAIVRKRIPPAIPAADGGRCFVDRFELGVEPGLGLASGQGSDPTVMIRWSKNYGKTWGSQLTRSAGAMGNYGARVFWWRCGSSEKSMVPEITVSDPVPWRIVDASFMGRGYRNQQEAA
jgi:hypothetical protein